METRGGEPQKRLAKTKEAYDVCGLYQYDENYHIVTAKNVESECTNVCAKDRSI